MSNFRKGDYVRYRESDLGCSTWFEARLTRKSSGFSSNWVAVVTNSGTFWDDGVDRTGREIGGLSERGLTKIDRR